MARRQPDAWRVWSLHLAMRRLLLEDSLTRVPLDKRQRLERGNQTVHWAPLAPMVAAMLLAQTRRPISPPLVMVTRMLRAQWDTLPTPQMAKSLTDHLALQRCVGLGVQDATPTIPGAAAFGRPWWSAGSGTACSL